MHIKHLKHGRGSAKAAADYLTGPKDALGQVRDEVRVPEGDPELVARVADSLPFQHRYTSGVIAWRPDEQPTEEQLSAVLADYKAVAFAGLSSEQYCFAAVLHRHGDAVHIHTLTARVELDSGRSMNIAPPGHLAAFDAVRDYHNLLNGWARPDDSERQRACRLPHGIAKINAQIIRQGLQVEPDPRQVLTDFLLQQAAIGKVTNRESIVVSLKEIGLAVPRAGKDYITVQVPETGDK